MTIFLIIFPTRYYKSHLISKEELSDMLASRPDDVTVIMTGRVLDDGIRKMADEIYNIASEK